MAENRVLHAWALALAWVSESSRFVGNGNSQSVDRGSSDDEGSEKHFGGHDDGGCRKKEQKQIATAPGLGYGGWRKELE